MLSRAGLVFGLGSTLVQLTSAQGQWSSSVQFPVIPVAGAVIPNQNKVLVWSAAAASALAGDGALTLTATLDLNTMTVSERRVDNTAHDMFCPGISLDPEGRLVVTGGVGAQQTSSYDYATDQWFRLSPMNVPRGYQSSSITSDGRIFTIGGSWSGGFGGKIGEIYDPKTDVWNTLPGCDSNAILTADTAGIFRQDNHASLFAWKDGSVFHAGPSKNMHWFDTRGYGRTVDAGTRGSGPDAICGMAVMYDTGKIVYAAGAPNYDNSDGTNRAFHITLGNTYDKPVVEEIQSLKFGRSQINSVVLPDGKILLTGGQKNSQLFTDNTAILTPELFDPATRSWTTLSNDTTPRCYHSISLLLQDATVFSGGGGGCANCPGNHLDGNIYKPPYLFNNGALAKRPVITSISTTSAPLGSSITVNLDTANAQFAWVRIGSATHTVNTDQRRLTVTPSSVTGGTTYVIPIPSDAGVAPPGYWYLFALDSNGVPSVAKTVKFTMTATPPPVQRNTPDPNLPCPGNTAPNSFFTAPNGDTFGICQNTNMNNGKDLSSSGNINSIQDCSALCANTPGCMLTTYIPNTQTCYLKAGRLIDTGAANPWSSSIKLYSKPCPNNASIASISTTTHGRIYGTCSNTDLVNNNAYVLWAVNDAASCARACESHWDCTNGVWMPSEQGCFMKTSIGPAKVDGRFSSVFRMMVSPCLNNAAPGATFTASNGDLYGICYDQDVYGSDIANRYAVNSIQDCAQLCSTTGGCVSATWISGEKSCWMKNKIPQSIPWTGRSATFKIGVWN